MNLVRHDLKQSTKTSRFPKKDIKQFPWCAEWEDDLRALFATYTEAKQNQNVRLRRLVVVLGRNDG
jgi:DNA helicase II / ATP-dependent DNA helicase PcrA